MTKQVVPTIGAIAGTYAAGDVIGGIVTLSDMEPVRGCALRLRSLSLKEAGGQTPALNILFFKATPSGGTYGDNAAFAWGSGDLANVVGLVQVTSADWFTVGSKSVVVVGDVGQLHPADSDAKVYMLVLVGSGGYTAGSNDALLCELEYEVVDG